MTCTKDVLRPCKIAALHRGVGQERSRSEAFLGEVHEMTGLLREGKRILEPSTEEDKDLALCRSRIASLQTGLARRESNARTLRRLR